MIIYYLPSKFSLQECFDVEKVAEEDFVHLVETFPFRYQNEMVEAYCNKRRMVADLTMKNLIKEYNIDGLSEIGLMVGSPNVLWIMDRRTRKIYTIQDNTLTEMEIGKNYSKTLQAVTIATYTDHSLILMEDFRTKETYLFGHGSNLHHRLKYDQSNDLDLSQPVFIPHQDLEPTSRITHISCSFSFSVCVINNRDVHLCGQDWINNTRNGGVSLSWKNLAFKCHEDVVSLCSGNFHFIAILKDYSILAGGSNDNGETLRKSHHPDLCIIPNNPFPVVSMSLGSNCSLLKSKVGTFHLFGRSYSPRLPDNQLYNRLLLKKNDRSIAPDEVFLERNNEVLHYKDNSLLMVMYNHPCLLRYSELPIPNIEFSVLPCGLVFYSKGSNNFQQLLYSTITNPNHLSISDITILC